MSPTIKKFHRIEAMFKDVKQKDWSIEYFLLQKSRKGRQVCGHVPSLIYIETSYFRFADPDKKYEFSFVFLT